MFIPPHALPAVPAAAVHALAARAGQNLTQLHIFLAFQFTGAVGIFIVLLTAIFANGVYRHFTWLNFCVSWLIYCISYTLLAFSGQQTRPQPPSFPLCVTQASLIYAAPVLVSMSTLGLVLQLHLTVRSMLLPPSKNHRLEWLRNGALMIAPYICWLIFTIVMLAIGTQNPTRVTRSRAFVYCKIDLPEPGNVTSLFVAIVLVIMVIFDAYIGFVLYRNWRALRGTPGKALPLPLIVRVALFTFVCVICIGASFLFLANLSSFVGNIFISIMPLIAFLVFGTQEDIIEAWIAPIKRWRAAKQSQPL